MDLARAGRVELSTPNQSENRRLPPHLARMLCWRLVGRLPWWWIRLTDPKGIFCAVRAPTAVRPQFRQPKHNAAKLLADRKQLNSGYYRVAGADPSRICAFATRRSQSAVTVRGSRWSAAGCRSNTLWRRLQSVDGLSPKVHRLKSMLLISLVQCNGPRSDRRGCDRLH